MLKKMTPTTQRLQEIHTNLFRPHNLLSLLRRNYMILLLDEYNQKSWILLLRLKDEFFDMFKLWLLWTKSNREKLDCLWTNSREEFIIIVVKKLCNERGVEIDYAVPYIHEENDIIDNCWQTFLTIKNSILIDSKHPIKIWAEIMDTSNYQQNQLPTRRVDKTVIVPEKAWTNTK